MEKTILSLLLCVAAIPSLLMGQDEIEKDKSYRFTANVPNSISTQTLEESGTCDNIRKDAKVTVLYKNDDRVYYSYWKFKDSSLESKYNADKVFSMSENEFKRFTTPRYPLIKGYSVGAYTVPAKLRFGSDKNQFDFESSLSLQANFIVGVGNSRSTRSIADFSLGLGITSVQLTPENALGEVETSMGDTVKVVSKVQTSSAFTVSGGMVIKATESANLGIFLGWDFLGKRDIDSEWIYNKKPWLGLGINVNISKQTSNKRDVFNAGKKNRK